jgi:hypothetical protein
VPKHQINQVLYTTCGVVTRAVGKHTLADAGAGGSMSDLLQVNCVTADVIVPAPLLAIGSCLLLAGSTPCW